MGVSSVKRLKVNGTDGWGWRMERLGDPAAGTLADLRRALYSLLGT